MSQSNELVKAVLVYCADRLVEGDIQSLLDLGLEDEDLKELATLKLVDLAQADRFNGCLRVEVELDVPAFRTMLHHTRAVLASEEHERALIMADAPFAMMNSLFGICTRDFTSMRAQLRVESPPGRPRAPDEGTVARLWHAIQRRVKERGQDSLLQPQDYLDIADECGTSMRHGRWRHKKPASTMGQAADPPQKPPSGLAHSASLYTARSRQEVEDASAAQLRTDVVARHASQPLGQRLRIRVAFKPPGRSFAAQLLLCAIVPFLTHAEEPPPYALDSLSRLLGACPAQDLNGLWHLYVSFFTDARAQNVTIADMEAIAKQCPPIGFVAHALGKERAAMGFLYGFNPPWANAGFWNGWRDQQMSLLPETKRSRSGDMEPYPLGDNHEWTKSPFGQISPFLQLSLGDYRERGLVDTGSSFSFIRHEHVASALQISDGIQMPVTLADGTTELIRMGRFPFAAVGHRTFESIVIGIGDLKGDTPSIIGMSFLLRFESVCFSWRESILYLGGLGPCASRAPSSAWHFGPSLELVSALPNASDLSVVIDSGSAHSSCPRGFFEAGIVGYKIPGEDMYVPCEYRDTIERGLLGMDTLLKFAAFGWIRDPLRVVFVR